MTSRRPARNAKTYQRRLRKLLRGLPQLQRADIPPGQGRVYFMIEAIFQADATRRQAAEAMASLKEEFLDLNELRVSPVRDIVECVGRDMPEAREKAEMATAALNDLFFRVNQISLDYLDQTPRTALKRALAELGLSPYAAASVALHVFGVHAMPVDWTLVESLKLGEYVSPNSEVADVQRMLERIVPATKAVAASAFLKSYAEKRAKQLPPKPQAEPVMVAAEHDPHAEPLPVPPQPVGTGGQAATAPAVKPPARPPRKKKADIEGRRAARSARSPAALGTKTRRSRPARKR